jgi:hypothetical protein
MHLTPTVVPSFGFAQWHRADGPCTSHYRTAALRVLLSECLGPVRGIVRQRNRQGAALQAGKLT